MPIRGTIDTNVAKLLNLSSFVIFLHGLLIEMRVVYTGCGGCIGMPKGEKSDNQYRMHFESMMINLCCLSVEWNKISKANDEYYTQVI